MRGYTLVADMNSGSGAWVVQHECVFCALRSSCSNCEQSCHRVPSGEPGDTITRLQKRVKAEGVHGYVNFVSIRFRRQAADTVQSQFEWYGEGVSGRKVVPVQGKALNYGITVAEIREAVANRCQGVSTHAARAGTLFWVGSEREANQNIHAEVFGTVGYIKPKEGEPVRLLWMPTYTHLGTLCLEPIPDDGDPRAFAINQIINGNFEDSFCRVEVNEARRVRVTRMVPRSRCLYPATTDVCGSCRRRVTENICSLRCGCISVCTACIEHSASRIGSDMPCPACGRDSQILATWLYQIPDSEADLTLTGCWPCTYCCAMSRVAMLGSDPDWVTGPALRLRFSASAKRVPVPEFELTEGQMQRARVGILTIPYEQWRGSMLQLEDDCDHDCGLENCTCVWCQRRPIRVCSAGLYRWFLVQTSALTETAFSHEKSMFVRVRELRTIPNPP